MNKKILTPMAHVSLVVFLVVVSILAWLFLYPEKQDVLLTANSSTALVGMDDMNIGTGTVCIPHVEKGTHIFTIENNGVKISDEFFVADNIVIINDEKKRNVGVDQLLTNGSMQLKIQPTSCTTWTFGSTPQEQ